MSFTTHHADGFNVFVYVKDKRRSKTGEYVGRPSVLGNPFRESVKLDRMSCIERYRDWLDHATPDMQRELDRLYRILCRDKRLTLLCWCAPMPCHADVIAGHLLKRYADDHLKRLTSDLHQR
jgi:hypothetical protein